MKKLIHKILCLLMVVILFACSAKEDSKLENRGMSYFDYFDTVSFIYSYNGDDEQQFNQKCEAASSILNEYNKLFDIYHEYEGINNLYTINANPGKFIEVDKKLIDFLLYCKDIYDLTNGKTNIMLGPVLKLWYEHRTKDDNTLPNDGELLEANKHTSIDNLIIDEKNNTVLLKDQYASIDVGAIAKGYATEKAAQYLFEIEAYSYVLNIGGNIRIIGSKPDGNGWNTSIKDPSNLDSYIMKINIKNTSCVTSGDYERYYMVDGKKYHHIIDPDTLYPANYFKSITVLCNDSGLADGLSTALYCMSYEEGLKLVEKLDNVDVIWIDQNNEIKYTKNIQSLIQ